MTSPNFTKIREEDRLMDALNKTVIYVAYVPESDEEADLQIQMLDLQLHNTTNETREWMVLYESILGGMFDDSQTNRILKANAKVNVELFGPTECSDIGVQMRIWVLSVPVAEGEKEMNATEWFYCGRLRYENMSHCIEFHAVTGRESSAKTMQLRIPLIQRDLPSKESDSTVLPVQAPSKTVLTPLVDHIKQIVLYPLIFEVKRFIRYIKMKKFTFSDPIPPPKSKECNLAELCEDLCYLWTDSKEYKLEVINRTLKKIKIALFEDYKDLPIVTDIEDLSGQIINPQRTFVFELNLDKYRDLSHLKGGINGEYRWETNSIVLAEVEYGEVFFTICRMSLISTLVHELIHAYGIQRHRIFTIDHLSNFRDLEEYLCNHINFVESLM